MITAVVTTIAKPDADFFEPLLEDPDCEICVVADYKTPVKEYEDYFGSKRNCKVLTVDEQKKRWPILFNNTTYNNPMIRNFGYLWAQEHQAQNGEEYFWLLSLDDDNFLNYSPTELLEDALTGHYLNLGASNKLLTVDPLHTALTLTQEELSPLENLIKHRGCTYPRVSTVFEGSFPASSCLVFQIINDGILDVDAALRLVTAENSLDYKVWPKRVKFGTCLDNNSPFNSQSTFINSKYLRYFCMLPGFGRAQDIYGSLWARGEFASHYIGYITKGITQFRNEHDVCFDLHEETVAYKGIEYLCSRSHFSGAVEVEAPKWIRDSFSVAKAYFGLYNEASWSIFNDYFD